MDEKQAKIHYLEGRINALEHCIVNLAASIGPRATGAFLKTMENTKTVEDKPSPEHRKGADATFRNVRIIAKQCISEDVWNNDSTIINAVKDTS